MRSIVVITGGQTGADLGGWKAARRLGLGTAGYMPIGFLNETGPHPEFARLYGAEEIDRNIYGHQTEWSQYATRRLLNVRRATVAILFGKATSRGSLGLLKDCRINAVPCFKVPGEWKTPRALSDELKRSTDCSRLLIAGNRESGFPGIERRTERFVFSLLKHIGNR